MTFRTKHVWVVARISSTPGSEVFWAPMFSLVLFMVHGSAIIMVHNSSRWYNRVHDNHLDDQVLE